MSWRHLHFVLGGALFSASPHALHACSGLQDFTLDVDLLYAQGLDGIRLPLPQKLCFFPAASFAHDDTKPPARAAFRNSEPVLRITSEGEVDTL